MNRLPDALWIVVRASLALGSAGFLILLVDAVWFSSATSFLIGGPAPFITQARPVDTQLVAIPPTKKPEHVFIQRFEAHAGEAAMVEVRALREFEVDVNGQRVETNQAPHNWRTIHRLAVGPLLKDGRNEIRIAVRNPSGPPVLQAKLDLGDRVLSSDEHWRVSVPGSNPSFAALADDTRIHPDSHLLAEPGQVNREHILGYALVFGFLSGMAWLALARRPQFFAEHGLWIASLLILGFWLLTFATKMIDLPVVMGFDAPAHLQYIETIREEGRLPLADEGFSNYHPPLYHALTAGLARATGVLPGEPSGRIVYRVVSALSGLACVLFAGLTARIVFPQSRMRAIVALWFAGLLPVNVYMSGYLGNETLHAACASGAIYFAVRCLACTPTNRVAASGLAISLGLALLTKFTSLMLAPILLSFVCAKMIASEPSTPRRTTSTMAGIVLTPMLVSGWFYVRNWIEFGDPVVWNLDIPNAASWWLQPGFHTPSYFMSFGEGIRHPLFAGFHSFWDGLYSTFWGDGLVAGMQTARTRHGLWNEDFMLTGYWLAFPIMLPLAFGFARSLSPAIPRPSSPRSQGALAQVMLGTVVLALCASMILITFRLPFYAQTKASYMLAGIVPLSLFMGDGVATFHEKLKNRVPLPVLAIFWGWLSALSLTLALSFLA